jgi:hypothetical protein
MTESYFNEATDMTPMHVSLYPSCYVGNEIRQK